MAAAPPPKIKAFLESTKKRLLDDEEDRSFPTYFQALLSLEILQRGVVVSSSDDPSKVLAAVTSVAGKALLNQSSGVPKPLLAGSSVIAGRMAEAACKAYSSGSNGGFPSDDVKTAMDRCKDVGDGRLQSLLQILTIRAETELENDIRNRLLYIAEGYYYRAGTFQPDAPPMFKKAWDVITERHQTQSLLRNPTLPWEAVVALKNLKRIAVAKGNTKRAVELGLRLAEAALDATVPCESTGNLDHALLLETFIAPHRPTDAYSSNEVNKIAAQALEELADDDNTMSPADNFVKLLLHVRLAHVQEEAAIQATADEKHKLATNRSDGKKVSSTEVFRTKARRDHLASTAEKDPFHETAEHLRDSLLSSAENDEDSICRRRQACFLLSEIVLVRLRDRAQAIGLSGGSGWQSVSEYMQPILRSFHAHSEWDSTTCDSTAVSEWLASLPKEEKNMVEAVVCLFPSVEWMLCGADGTSYGDLRQLVQVILRCLYEESVAVEGAFERQKQKDAVVSSSVGSNQRRLKTLAVHCACSEILIALGGFETGQNIRSLVDDAVSRSQQPEDENAEFSALTGHDLLDFMVCWNGLMDSPWSFCTLPEARTIVRRARRTIKFARDQWGRSVGIFEECLLDMGEADAEGPAFGFSGLVKISKSCYNQVQARADSLPDGVAKKLLVAKCQANLARHLANISSPSDETSEEVNDPETLARGALESALSLKPEATSRPLYLWRAESASEMSVAFHVASFRQLVADILIRNGQEEAAEQLLEDAVKEAPTDAGAAYALGAYRLRLMFFGSEKGEEFCKAAQIQLLKAAKLDSSRASPFALLGVWYENRKDTKRAVGCYSKAILLDPCQPVAGRGLIRLAKPDSLKSILDKAITTSSALSGWAWRAIARQKALVDGNDNLGVVSFLKALRCRDIERPEEEPLAVFFANPLHPRIPCRDELAAVLADLAACYRRLGRFTAAIWSFRSSIKEGADRVPGHVYCSCAQVELELGLFDEAAENFAKAAGSSDSVSLWATYGQGVALLAMAQRDNQDGKCGSAFVSVTKAIEGCELLNEKKYGAIQKLLGDLYTFGGSLPLDIFAADKDLSEDELLETQLAFISKGEKAYQNAEQAVEGPDTSDNAFLRASFITDLGANKLLQAQAFAFFDGRGLIKVSQRTIELFEKAAIEFRRALEHCPLYAPAWCGLGCSVSRKDPILAQHAFCRSIELDHQFPDAYCNLSFLYTQKNALSQSAGVSDALTQIADTSMMWINRALILERESTDMDQHESSAHLRRAADAYRAALQVDKDPCAMFGLSLTCRHEETLTDDGAALESYAYTTEYLGGKSSTDCCAQLVNAVSSMELGTHGVGSSDFVTDGERVIREGLSILREQEFVSKSLDVELLDSLLNRTHGDETDIEENSNVRPFDHLSLARRIVHEPHRGDLWLSLAKELALRNEGVDDTRDAVRRALSILTLQHEKPTKGGIEVRAKDLSDAYAISYWLNNMEDQDLVSSKKDTDTEEGDTSSELPSFYLQKALLLHPGNALARSALSDGAS